MNYQYRYQLPFDPEVLEPAMEKLEVTFSTGSFVSLVIYVLSALALYTIAKRRGLKNPWLAWIPVGFEWLLGSVSDQYQYLVKERNTSRRKLLLGISLINTVIAIVLMVTAIVMIVRLAISARVMTEAEIAQMIMGPVITVAVIGVLLVVMSVVLIVVRCMSLYDLYRSTQPDTAVVFLVIGILLYGAEALFLMIVRNKDEGMPPRKPEQQAAPRVYQPEELEYETVEPVSEEPQKPLDSEE